MSDVKLLSPVINTVSLYARVFHLRLGLESNVRLELKMEPCFVNYFCNKV